MMKTIKIHSLNRREFIHSAGLGALGLGFCGNLGHAQEVYGVPQAPAPEQKQVYGIWRYVGSVYYFDPIGLYVQPGDTVGFVIVFSSGRTPTVTAYHPENDNHELRIPERPSPSIPERWSPIPGNRPSVGPLRRKGLTTTTASSKKGWAWPDALW